MANHEITCPACKTPVNLCCDDGWRWGNLNWYVGYHKALVGHGYEVECPASGQNAKTPEVLNLGEG